VRALRAVLFWTHLAAGLSAGLVILVMCVTGAALALKPQILAAIDRGVITVREPTTDRLPISTLLRAATAGRPDATPSSIVLERDPRAAVLVAFDRDATVAVDPYRGVILGARSASAQTAFRTIEDWHRWLAMSGDGRATGRAITGASNVAFLVLALSGIYLWWPRRWTVQHTRAILAFRRAATPRARDFNWHNVIGFWCAPLIVVMAATGMVMSYPWANDLLYRVTGSTPPDGARGGSREADRNAARGDRAGRRGGAERSGAASAREGERRSAVTPDQLDRAWRRAEEALPTWRTITLRLGAGDLLAFSIVDGASWNRFGRSQLSVRADTGEAAAWQPYAGMSLGQRARNWVRFSHTGELGGIVGQVLAAIGCVGGSVLVWTGVSLACRRFAAWRARRTRESWALPAVEGDQSY
jgi:uncharacterized iron-regulated membrane protein